MPLDCAKNLVKIGPVVSEEKILLLTSCYGVFRRISPDVLDRYSQSFYRMKSLYVLKMDQYCIFEFVKQFCHGNQ